MPSGCGATKHHSIFCVTLCFATWWRTSPGFVFQNMASLFIHYEQSEIHYLHYGNGSVNIVCLHGYGESAASFRTLIKYLPDEFSLIAIDLPFHGSTQWNEKRAFKIADLACILKNIFKELPIHNQHFILMGYSMGGRIAMSLLQYMPDKILKLVLLAPDGMKVNFWYWLATQTRAGNRIFRFTMNNPEWFLTLLKVSNRFKLINKSVFKFTNAYIEDENIRNQLFDRWTCLRTFKPDIKEIRAIIEQKQLPVRMLYGKHDRIIMAKRAGKFLNGAGHQVLQQKHACTIIKLLTT